MAPLCVERAGLGAGAWNLIAACALSPAEASGAARIGLALGCTVLGSNGAGEGGGGEKAGAPALAGLRAGSQVVGAICHRRPGRPCPRSPGADGDVGTLPGRRPPSRSGPGRGRVFTLPALARGKAGKLVVP